MILNGKKYRLIPVENEWQIVYIYPNDCGMRNDGKPLLALGHNGCNLPAGHSIDTVELGKERFAVGDIITEGKIECFIYENHYVMAKIVGSEVLVDIDNFKKI